MKRILLYLIFFVNNAYSQHLLKIPQDGKVGYIDLTGQIVIPPRYFSGADFSEGLAAVREDSLYGYIDEKGGYVIPPKYNMAMSFSEGYAIVYRGGKRYMINHEGEEYADEKYFYTGIKNHIATIQLQRGSRRAGLINLQTGKLLIDTIFYAVERIDSGLYRVLAPGGNYALIDEREKWLYH